ncbi:hypothetical protein Q3O60_06270 [Alkalimonas collagenimarina]|uniref:Phage holin family protein n=1 Tax=Alkalimonas collagenimarina TaxID=400390 RepID=A0ABT9GXJ9_9GAMM|nr:hypothetical protein [Alkalimonas collagenimarina]MDP4535784.1 hypothetical protein [Alkalimonas collagenimarina]
MPAKATDTATTTGAASAEPDITAEAIDWWLQIKTLAHGQLELLTLEGERVARSMVALLVFALLAGLLVLTLWFAVLTQIVLLAQLSALAVWQSLGLAMIVNLLAIWFLLRRCLYYSRLLRFPATVQSLRPIGTQPPPAAKQEA